MRNLALTRSLAALGTLAFAAWGGQAFALEPGSSDPHLPGVSDGVPAGALPPPGIYAVNTLAYNDGTVEDNSGNKLPFNATAWIEIPGVTWVTPWHFLGASYAVSIAQPLVTLSVSAPGVTQGRTGVFNTVLVPGILSWQLPMGFFASTSFVVYLPDGDTGDRGNGTRTQQHIANNTTTFAPGGALSWFNGHGFIASANLEYDVQTQNDKFDTPTGTKYQSGELMNWDFSVLQELPGAYKKWTVGGVGFWSQQMTGDSATGGLAPLFNANGNHFKRIGLGPYIGYDFGPVGMNFWYTRDVEARNAAKGDTFWFRFALPL